MSITNLLSSPTIRTALDPLVDVTRTQIQFHFPLRVPLGRKGVASLLGTAFDYGFRFLLQRLNPHANTRSWVAERAAEQLSIYCTDTLDDHRMPIWEHAYTRMARRAAVRVRNARIFLRKHLKRRKISASWLERLAVHALKLARLDPVIRAGYIDEAIVATDEPATVAELVNLLRLVPLERFCGQPLWLNPTFGEYSSVVGGADADIIVGNRLIELKTRSNNRVERNDVRQLLMYAMLADLARISDGRLPEVSTLEIYFARYGELISMDLMPARRLAYFESAREVVLEEARHRYGPQREAKRVPRNPFLKNNM